MLKKLIVALVFAIIVATEASADETCTLFASPTSIPQGGTAYLSQESTTPLTIDNGIGAAIGTVLVSPQETTTYTGTTNGNATCSVTVTVVAIPQNLRNLFGIWQMSFTHGRGVLSTGEVFETEPEVRILSITDIQKNGDDGIIFSGVFTGIENSSVWIWLNEKSSRDLFISLNIPSVYISPVDGKKQYYEYIGNFNMTILPENPSGRVGFGMMSGMLRVYEFPDTGMTSTTLTMYHSDVRMDVCSDCADKKKK